MKNADIIALFAIAGVSFALWKWKPQQKRVLSDSQNIANDWRAVGGDVQNAMYRYDRQK